jgi:hypothetical protein
MKAILLTILFVVSLQQSQQSDFATLWILEGTWAMKTPKGTMYEHWRKISDSELRSKSFKLNGRDTVLMEQVRLYHEGGDVYYTPVVEDQNNRQPIPFKLTEVESSRYTFENKEHDFPQRIIYNIVSHDSIVARIEGTKNNMRRSSDFIFVRVK